MKFKITLEREESGFFVAECSTLPGCVSQGRTREDALKNIKDAIKGYLISLKKHNEPIPPSIDEEVVEVNV
ncbi:type II toxin-antitoxin system HicB family antitoxin [archaeon]|nr:type II toxin-antitoxin system HicB family antitoxin [archaeon]